MDKPEYLPKSYYNSQFFDGKMVGYYTLIIGQKCLLIFISISSLENTEPLKIGLSLLYRKLAIFILLLPIMTFAQVDSIVLMEIEGPEVSIISSISDATPIKARPSDRHIAAVLGRNIGLQIQGQGGSYLRTALYRGQSARHMAILWEGVNIQNQFNGTYDLGLIPSVLFGGSQWYDGGHSAAVGNAAMSGALVLAPDIQPTALKIGAQFNDQNNRNISVVFNASSGKVTHTLGLSHWDNANEYRYKDFNEILKRKHSEHTQVDLSYQGKFAWSKKLQSKISYWYQSAERNLPASIVASALAHQKDKNHRLSVSNIWQITPSQSLYSSLTYMNEYLGYYQPGINSEGQSSIWNFNSKYSWKGDIDHNVGVNVRSESGELVDTLSPGFQSFFPERLTTALFYNGGTKWQSSSLNFSFRQEWVDEEFQIPTLQIAYRYDCNKDLGFSFNLGNHFTYPGFNDLFWPIGGNPNLATENSYQIDLGMQTHGMEFSLFGIVTTDKIVWAPNEQNILTPENISSTRSIGFDVKYNTSLEVKDIMFSFNPILNYNHTVNTTKGINKGNELIYNPAWNTRVNLDMSYDYFNLLLGYSFTSQRFQAVDNSSVLDAYQLLDAEIGYTVINHTKYNASIRMGANNIFDQSYQLVRHYPQALRSIYLGFNISCL